MAITALVALTLTSCTPAVGQHWRLGSDGSIAAAWCRGMTVDSISVRTLAGESADEAERQSFTVRGPEVYLARGEAVSLGGVASSWSAGETVDVAADWDRLEITASLEGRVVDISSIERRELPEGEWVMSPPPGILTDSCDLVL